jgi:phenylalanyl-tRNA synthetase beta subunit
MAAWLAQAIGLRPISALVDITNFLTFDLNRSSVFDGPLWAT